MTIAPDVFLSSASAAGLLHELDGWRYVADYYVDDASGQEQCLVEYADPELIASQTSGDALLAELRQRFPAAGSVLLRTSAEARLPPPWCRYLTYLRHSGQHAGHEGGSSDPASAERSPVIVAGEEHHVCLRRWLEHALRVACAEQDRQMVGTRLRAAADSLLSQPDRVSYVYLRDGTPVGHVTLLCDCQDDLTQRRFAELFDLLVDPVDDRAEVSGSLVTAAVRHAAGLELPLLGHVVHPVSEAGASGAMKVLDGLLSAGWATDHMYWTHPLDGGEPQWP